MTDRSLALVLAVFGALMLVLTYVFAWQTGTFAVAVVFNVAGIIVALLIIKASPPRGGGRR